MLHTEYCYQCNVGEGKTSHKHAAAMAHLKLSRDPSVDVASTDGSCCRVLKLASRLSCAEPHGISVLRAQTKLLCTLSNDCDKATILC